ncbi:Ubiquinone biosynthesis O-methyltransferase, mitochondrial [subsurface metagenome]
MEDTFYEADTSEEAIRRYLKANDTLYDRIKNKTIENIMSSLIDFIKGIRVLEVGAGGGIWTEFFIKQRANVTCVDLCEKILKGNASLHPQASFILGDATTMKLKEKFDLIFAKDIIEHIEEDIRFLKNMNEHLRENGLLLINTQNSFSLNYLIEGGWAFLRGNKNWCGWDPTHVRFYTPWILKRKLHIAGFKVIKQFGCYHFPYRFISRKLIGKVRENKVFHLVEILGLYDKFPFSLTGWGLGLVAKKVKEV